MRYKEEFIKKVLDKTDIVKVISKFTPLHEENGLYVGNCVLHKDDSESMVVYPDKQVFHCFGCGKGGNAATFLMELKGIHMDKAVEALARLEGMKIEKDDVAKKTNDVLKSNLYAIYKDAAYFYKRKLYAKEGEQAMQYLKGRSLTEETIKSFNLGYSPTQGDALYKELRAKGYTDDLMIQAGLIRISDSGQPYDMFRGRVIFPIMNEKRQAIAFGGRRLADETEADKRQPKYLNSPETPIFNKSNTLYGIHDLKGAKKEEYLFLVEGYMDVIALHQAGFQNSVAALGTAFTPTHIPEIKKYANNLILAFDGDGAGQKAAMRAIKALEGSDIGCRVLSLSPYKDPDEFIKALGTKEYAMRVRRSVDAVDFKLKVMAEPFDLKDPKQKHEYLMKAVEVMMKQQEREIEGPTRGR